MKNQKHKTMVRVICLVIAALMVLGSLSSVLFYIL